MADATCLSCILEVVDEKTHANHIIAQKVMTLKALVVDSISQGETVSLVQTDVGIAISAFDSGTGVIEIVKNVLSEIDQFNMHKVDQDTLKLKAGFGRAHLFNETDFPEQREAVLTSSIARAQQLTAIGEVGHILISDEIYKELIIRSPYTNIFIYHGLYQVASQKRLAVWGMFAPNLKSCSKKPPKSNRLEDERGIPEFLSPNLNLKRPRSIAKESVDLSATNEAKVLVLSPHPNDAPWGCAGTIFWLRRKYNARVYLHFLTSTRSPHVVGNFAYGPPSRSLSSVLWSYGILTDQDPLVLLDELVGLSEEDAIRKVAEKIPRLARTPHQVYIEGFLLDSNLDRPPLPPEGMFADGSIDKYAGVLRERLAWLQREISPDIVLCPSLKDIHQDHKITAEAAVSTFKFQESIWFYELPQASRNPFYYFSPNLFIDIAEFADKKLMLLEKCFPHDIKRFHFSPDGARALMLTRGIEGYYERTSISELTEPTAPHVEAFEARIYF